MAGALGVAPGAFEAPVIAASEAAGGELEAVPTQFDPSEPGGLAGELTLLLPPLLLELAPPDEDWSE